MKGIVLAGGSGTPGRVSTDGGKAGGDTAENGRIDDKEKGFTAIGISKCGQYIQATGGLFCRGTH